MRINKSFAFFAYRQDWYLFIIFALTAIGIVVKSYFNANGYLSPDSTNYLKLAQSLLEGKGYFVSAYGNTGQDREFFAIWPIGYPTLIYLLAKLTGFSVFWASKLLNIFLVMTILGIFRALFKENAYIYGAILLFSSYIKIFSYTWSETMFIAGLLCFATALYLFINNPKKASLLYLYIMAASLLLFLSRYIGAFSFGLIGLLGLYYGLAKKEKSTSVILISIAAINITIMLLYLYHNYVETGFPTGMKRISSPETNQQLFFMLFKATIEETLIPIANMSRKTIIVAIIVFFTQFSALAFLLWKYRKNMFRLSSSATLQPLTLSFVFMAIGLVYLFFIILMRWLFHFDGFSYRLLGPGSFLLFIGIIYVVQQRGSQQFFDAFKSLVILFAVLSFFLSVPYKSWKSHALHPTYFETLDMLKEQYSNVDEDAVVIFAPIHINYLYSDMQCRRPYSFPHSDTKESWFDFINRIDSKKNRSIYLHVPEKELQSEKYDQSVLDLVNNYDKGSLVKIR